MALLAVLSAPLAAAQVLAPPPANAPLPAPLAARGGQIPATPQAGGVAPADQAPGPAHEASGAGPGAQASGSDLPILREAVEAAKAGEVTRARALQTALSDPLARRIVDWAMIDRAGSMLDFFTLDAASRDLAGWPRGERRREAAEKAMEASGVPPSQTIAWFSAQPPLTPEGAMALAAAYQAAGHGDAAASLIRNFWRSKIFEADAQARMRARFGAYLTADDDAQRLEILLYGPQGPAARAMLDLVDPDHRALALARIALKADRTDAPSLVAAVPPALASDPGLSFDRAKYLQKRQLDVIAIGLAKTFPMPAPDTGDIAHQIWGERRAIMNAALRDGDAQSAYAVVSAHGLPPGPDYAEAEFFSGWIALTRLHDPVAAGAHFANLESDVSSPQSVSRADYWRARAAEAAGDAGEARSRYAAGARYYTTFYGQLCLEKTGGRDLVLGSDPPTAEEDRAAFAADDLVRAARLLSSIGDSEDVRAFLLTATDRLTRPGEAPLLVDLARALGDQDLAMRVARNAARRGVFLPERGYPVIQTPHDERLAEPAFMLAIARQESNFDPNARSGPGARGLMQLMPTTASVMARRLGISFSQGLLEQPDYNLRLGGLYLSDLVDVFGGSYVLASAGYNAGPRRSNQWTGYCGDPRGDHSDPIDYIECIPFSETRNYVMRVLETTQIYRARLGGGSAPLTLSHDLKRGVATGSPPTPPWSAPPLGTPTPTPLSATGASN